MNYVHLQKPLYIPGLSYIQLLRYAARLRLKLFSPSAIEGRVEELLNIMNLTHCKNRIIDENPVERGDKQSNMHILMICIIYISVSVSIGRIGGELRRLSIAVEIVALPPLLILEVFTARHISRFEISLQSSPSISIFSLRF